MEISEILSRVDHTLLSQDSTLRDIRTVCDEGIRFKTASVCIPPSYVEEAKKYVNNQIRICTVIGFPNGYSTAKTKVFETLNAVSLGADEIDAVINIGDLKDKRYDKILYELKEIRKACEEKILKVIIETCLLTEDEKIIMCDTVSRIGADFIKTSTGFSKGGATPEDIILFSKHLNNRVKIKAAGGINSIEDAENFIRLGANRLGTSKIIKILERESKNYGNSTY